jgi:hypothetical protein
LLLAKTSKNTTNDLTTKTSYHQNTACETISTEGTKIYLKNLKPFTPEFLGLFCFYAFFSKTKTNVAFAFALVFQNVSGRTNQKLRTP